MKLPEIALLCYGNKEEESSNELANKAHVAL